MLTEAAPTVSSEALDDAVRRAEGALLARQRSDGHWVFELEADATIPAEYIMLQHFLDEIDDELNVKARAVRRRCRGARCR
jgi:squalene-hopene/tetraprenyl-beta-curcumene cyclase